VSTSSVVVIHCDGELNEGEPCAEWVYASDGFGNSLLDWRRAMGWTMSRTEGGQRQDYCPACSTARAEAAAG
jgi:hypothetical protein